MEIKEILKGESQEIEFKKEIPEKSEKYLKSIIAFANTHGGKVVIGVEDETLQLVGVNEKDVFQMMDKITNAIFDNCEPQIIPNITFQTLEDKCLIIVEIYPGANRPYYFKARGKEKGTYIRIGGTSRPADLIRVRELEMEGQNLSWDEIACIGFDVTEAAVSKLCHDVSRYMGEATRGSNSKYVTAENLLNWNVLKQAGHSKIATNSFALLTSDFFRFAKIQCALFKGKDRDIFIDKKTYDGPLYEQIENAYQFVLRHINLSSEIEGLVRKDRYELPPSAIREMIVNAVCHRNYLDSSCIQVAIFDDRLEVTSPGMLYGGLTLSEALQGRSKIRNRAIAEVLSRMEIVEAWGTGIKRILRRAEEYQLPIPKFEEIGDTFRVNLYRPLLNETKKPIPEPKKPINEFEKPISEPKKPISEFEKPISEPKKPIKTSQRSRKIKQHELKKERENRIMNHIEEFGFITNKEAREVLKLADSTTKRLLKQMVEEELLTETGTNKARKYYKKS